MSMIRAVSTGIIVVEYIRTEIARKSIGAVRVTFSSSVWWGQGVVGEEDEGDG